MNNFSKYLKFQDFKCVAPVIIMFKALSFGKFQSLVLLLWSLIFYYNINWLLYF